MIAGTKIKMTLLGIFVLGVVVGLVGDRVMQMVPKGFPQGRPEGRDGGPGGKAIDMLKERLNLRADQITKVDEILDQAGQEYMKVRSQIHPQFEEIRNRQRSQIQAILDPPKN